MEEQYRELSTPLQSCALVIAVNEVHNMLRLWNENLTTTAIQSANLQSQ